MISRPRSLKLSTARSVRKRGIRRLLPQSQTFPRNITTDRSTIAEICKTTASSSVLPLSSSSMYLKSAVYMEKQHTQLLHTDTIAAEHEIVSNANNARRKAGSFQHGSLLNHTSVQNKLKLTQKQRQELLLNESNEQHDVKNNKKNDSNDSNLDISTTPLFTHSSLNTNQPPYPYYGAFDLQSPNPTDLFNPSLILNDLHKQLLYQQQHAAYLNYHQQQSNETTQPSKCVANIDTQNYFDQENHTDLHDYDENHHFYDTDLTRYDPNASTGLDLYHGQLVFHHNDSIPAPDMENVLQFELGQSDHDEINFIDNSPNDFNDLFTFDELEGQAMLKSMQTNAFEPTASTFFKLFGNSDENDFDLTLFQHEHPSFAPLAPFYSLIGSTHSDTVTLQPFLKFPQQNNTLFENDLNLDENDSFLALQSYQTQNDHNQDFVKKSSHFKPPKKREQEQEPSHYPLHILSPTHPNKDLILRDTSLIVDPELAQNYLYQQKEYESTFITIQLSQDDLYNPGFSPVEQLYHAIHGEFTLHHFYLPSAYQPHILNLCETSLTTPENTFNYNSCTNPEDDFNQWDNQGPFHCTATKRDRARQAKPKLAPSSIIFPKDIDCDGKIVLFRPEMKYSGDLLGLSPLQITIQHLYYLASPSTYINPKPCTISNIHKRALFRSNVFSNLHNGTYIAASTIFNPHPPTQQISTCSNHFILPAPFSILQALYTARLVESDQHEARNPTFDNHLPEYYDCLDYDKNLLNNPHCELIDVSEIMLSSIAVSSNNAKLAQQLNDITPALDLQRVNVKLGPNATLNTTASDRLHLYAQLLPLTFPSYSFFKTSELQHYQPTSLHYLTFQTMTQVPIYFSTMPNLTQHQRPLQLESSPVSLLRIQQLINLVKQHIPTEYNDFTPRNDPFEQILVLLYTCCRFCDTFNLTNSIYGEVLPHLQFPELLEPLFESDPTTTDLLSDDQNLIDEDAICATMDSFNETNYTNNDDIDNFLDNAATHEQLSVVSTPTPRAMISNSQTKLTPSQLVGDGNNVDHLTKEQILAVFDAFDHNHTEIGHILMRLSNECITHQQHLSSDNPIPDNITISIPVTALLAAYTPTISAHLLSKSAAATVFVSLLGLNRAKVINLSQSGSYREIFIVFGPLWNEFVNNVIFPNSGVKSISCSSTHTPSIATDLSITSPQTAPSTTPMSSLSLSSICLSTNQNDSFYRDVLQQNSEEEFDFD